jgi:septal ring factor EnvC (AmiA/AmiB activator)
MGELFAACKSERTVEMKTPALLKTLLLCLTLVCAGFTWAQATQEPRTSDGRAFSTLSEEERKAQPFVERIAYNKWLKSKLEAEAKELDIRKAEQNAKIKELDERIDALDKRLRDSPEAKLNDYVVKAKRNEIRASVVPPDVRAAMSRIAALTPPPQFILEVRAACDALGIPYKK